MPACCSPWQITHKMCQSDLSNLFSFLNILLTLKYLLAFTCDLYLHKICKNYTIMIKIDVFRLTYSVPVLPEPKLLLNQLKKLEAAKAANSAVTKCVACNHFMLFIFN